MATYYRWRQNTFEYASYVKEESTSELAARFSYIGDDLQSQTFTIYYGDSLTVDDIGLMSLSGNVGSVTFTWSGRGKYLTDLGVPSGEKYIAFNQSENISDIDLIYNRGTNVCRCNTEVTKASFSGSSSRVADVRLGIDYQLGQTVKNYGVEINRGSFVKYVYSASSSTYPNGGVFGSYYYDQRTTVTSPTAPTGLTYPNPITTPTVTVSWDAATSNVPGVTVQKYRVYTYYNGSSVARPTVEETTSTNVQGYVPAIYDGVPVSNVKFSVVAIDSNGQISSACVGNVVPVYFSPNLTVPSLVMQGQPITVNWTSITGATSYTLQRKASTDTDWVEIYSGANTTFSETVGTWTTVQYRVQAVFDGTPGGWAESAAIPVVSASSLVISGTDEDLGVVTNDIPYSISTDTGNQITATITVNNAVIFSGNVGNSTADVIPVLDLITGEGTIVISATVDASGSPVTATRTWTYEKAAITFPNSGSVAQVTKEGENIYPKVLAEGVRLPGGKTLDQVMGFPAQIYTGSYTGTGTSGASNLVTLTFPFDPKIVFIARETTPTGGSLGTITPMIKGVQQSIVGINGNSRSIAYLTWGNNSLSFYGNGGADTSLNESGINYYYVALG